jgi:opacity protein-like surface antigen
MFKKLKLTGLLAVGMVANSIVSAEFLDCCSTYVGVTAKVDGVNLRQDMGAPLFKRSLPSAGVFAGIQLNESFGVEFGYDHSKRSNRTNVVNSGQVLPGAANPIAVREFMIFKTGLRINTFHVGLTGRYELDFKLIPNTFVFGTVGVAHVNVKARQQYFNSSVPATGEQLRRALQLFSTDYTKQKIVPKVALGLEHFLGDNVSMRLFANWIGTAPLRITRVGSNEKRVLNHQIKFKDTLGYGVSLKYSF